MSRNDDLPSALRECAQAIDLIRENVSHLARGCRAHTSHNPAPHVNAILVALAKMLRAERYAAAARADQLEKTLREAREFVAFYSDEEVERVLPIIDAALAGVPAEPEESSGQPGVATDRRDAGPSISAPPWGPSVPAEPATEEKAMSDCDALAEAWAELRGAEAIGFVAEIQPEVAKLMLDERDRLLAGANAPTDACPMCGSPVRVNTSNEGTSSYQPIAADAIEKARALTGVGHGVTRGEPVNLGSYAWVEAAFSLLRQISVDAQEPNACREVVDR